MSTLADLLEAEHQWRKRVDAFIEMGYGDVPQDEIPADWKLVRGPDRSFSAESKANVSAAAYERWRKSSPVVCKPRAKHKSRKRARFERALIAGRERWHEIEQRRAAIKSRWEKSRKA